MKTGKTRFYGETSLYTSLYTLIHVPHFDIFSSYGADLILRFPIKVAPLRYCLCAS